jgi:LemA protein
MSVFNGKRTGLIVVAIVVIVVLVFAAWWVGTYNRLVNEEETVDSKWYEVTNQYDRKFELIPDLINTTDSYLNWESSTLTNITALRTQWTNALGQGDMEGLANVSEQLEARTHNIIVAIENYPGLDSVYLVQQLMDEITGTENQIAVARMRYNEAVKVYNAHLKSFPASIVADSGGFEERKYYQGAASPPAP